MKASTILTAIVCAAALGIYLTPPPAGVSAEMMHAAALVVFTVGLWAIGSLPEHIVGFLFFMLAMALSVAPAQVVFSGFASPTLWLVLGGLIMAEAVNRTGLAQRLAGALFDRFALSYRQLVIAVVLASIVLSFLIPATVGRVLLLLPIVMALAQRVGFEHDSTGYNGLCLATIIAFVLWLFPATSRPVPGEKNWEPLAPEQRRMIAILAVALLMWATDFIHGIQSGWIALAAGTACLLPYIGVMPVAAFHQVRVGTYFYVGATLGLGLVIQKTGLSDGLGRLLHDVLPLAAGSDFLNFITISTLATFAGLFSTNPAQPAVMAPLAEGFVQATGWSLKTALMATAVGFTTFLLPYQVPPAMVGLQVGALRVASMLRLVLPLAAFSLLVMLPLQYLWWRVIGMFG